MQLTRYEEDMLAGRHGPAKQRAMEGLTQLGKAYGAARMVEIGYAHIHAGMALYLEDIQLMEQLADLDAQMAVPASSNIANADMLNWQQTGAPESLVKLQKRAIGAHNRMGSACSFTCTPYWAGHWPTWNMHMTSIESTVTIFCNSVIGARSNRDGFFAVYAGITGRYPLFGYHLAENRRGPLAAELPPGFGPIEIIPNGIDTARFRTGVQRHLQQVAFLGRHDPRKGFEVLKEAWKVVSEKIPGAELVVMGIEGTEKNRIRYLGRVDEDEKSRRLQASEVFVAPNLSGESFGVVVAEGMAAGCAIVASDIGAFRAVTGGTARLVPPGDPGHLAATLIELLRSPAATRDMGKRARQRVAEFDWSRVLTNYRDGYRRAIEIYKPAR